MSTLFKILVIAIFTFSSLFADAQFPVTVSIAVSPPYSAKIDDYISQPNKILATIINTSSAPLTVYLQGFIIGEGGIKIYTNPKFKPSQPLILQPGIPFRMNRNNIDQVFNADHLVYQGITQEQLIYMNMLPEGEFTICIRAFDYNTNQPLSSEEPLGCSNSFMISDVEPPVIIRPDCSDTITASTPQSVLFSWTRPPGSPLTIQYILKIIEVQPIDRNINDALRSASHPVFFEKTINYNTYLMGGADPALVAGKKYAFMVIAFDPMKKINFRNQGMSEVCWFYYKEKTTVNPYPVRNTSVTSILPLVLNIHTIKGKLSWAYRVAEANDEIQSGQQQNGLLLPEVQNMPGNLLNGNPPVSVQGTNPHQQQQQTINSLLAPVHYPLSLAQVDFHLTVNPVYAILWNNQHPNASEPGYYTDLFIGSTLTDINGNFSFPYIGNIPAGHELKIILNNSHFIFANTQIPININNDGTIDIGELLGISKTLRLKISALGDNGNPLDQASVEILRVKGFYQQDPVNQSLEHEVMRDKIKSDVNRSQNNTGSGLNSNLLLGNNNIEKEIIGSGKSGDIFPRLFFSDNADDRYIIRVKTNGLSQEFLLRIPLQNDDFLKPEVKLYNKNYSINLPNPVVKGRILSSEGHLPVVKANIILRPANYQDIDPLLLFSLQRYCQSDSLGKFIIENIQVRDKPYELLVNSGDTHFKDPNPLHLTQKGIIENRDPLLIETDMYNVCGTVMDANSVVLAGATLFWKEGGDVFYTNNNGKFSSKQSKGKHKLIAQFPGFRDTEAEIDVNATTAVVIRGNNGNNLLSCKNDIVMKSFIVKVLVKDAITKQAIKLCTVQAINSNKIVLTDQNGLAYPQDVNTGNAIIIVKGPDTENYIPVKHSFTVNNNKDTTLVTVSLVHGAVLSGKVFLAGSGIQNATVSVEGKDYISTTASSTGSYTLRGVPSGENNILAFKTAYLGDDSIVNCVQGQNYSVDFTLSDPGFNAGKLLGFDLVLLKKQPGTNPNEFIISGKLINLPTNTVFAVKPNTVHELGFSDQVIIINNGQLSLKNGILQTDCPDLPLSMYNYLDLVLHDDAGLKVKPVGSDFGKGAISGKINLDLNSSFPNLNGLKFPKGMVSVTAGNITDIQAITSDGINISNSFQLTGGADNWEIYGIKFKPKLSESVINSSGINLKGDLSFGNIPVLGNTILQLSNLTITKTGQIKDISFVLDPKPQISFGQWVLKPNEITFDAYGLKFNGDMDIKLPSTPAITSSFSDLAISGNGITGGTFNLPANGINILSIGTFKTANGSKLSMQKMPASDHYQLTGSGTLSLPKYLNDPAQLEYLQFSTNGQIAAHAKPGISINFYDMGSFRLNTLDFDMNTPAIKLNGGFKLDIPEFGAETNGGIKYTKNKVDVDQLQVNFNIQSKIKIETKLNFNDNGFSGDGKFFLSSIPYPVDIDFHYFKLQNGKDIGSHFKVGVSIQMGYAKLTEINGGFNYNSSLKEYIVKTGGKLTFAADPDAIVALYPMEIEIKSTPGGPIYTGICDLTIMDKWKIANSTMFCDLANKHYWFEGKTGYGFNLIKGVSLSAEQIVYLEASSKTNDSWWFGTGTSNVTALNQTIMDVGITFGWNAKKSDHQKLSGIPDYVLTNDRLYGGYLHLPVNFLSGNWGPYGYHGLADVSAWLSVTAEVDISANFKQNSYHLFAEQSGSAGINACFIYGLGCTGISATASGKISGDYINNEWSISGHGHACGEIAIGCNCSCNDWCTVAKVIPCGAKICLGVGGGIGYSSANGFNCTLGLDNCAD